MLTACCPAVGHLKSSRDSTLSDCKQAILRGRRKADGACWTSHVEAERGEAEAQEKKDAVRLCKRIYARVVGSSLHSLRCGLMFYRKMGHYGLSLLPLVSLHSGRFV